MKKKNTKWDLVWIIPEIIGSLGIVASAVYYLYSITPPSSSLMFWIFNLGLVMVVLDLGFTVFRKGLDELREALHK